MNQLVSPELEPGQPDSPKPRRNLWKQPLLGAGVLLVAAAVIIAPFLIGVQAQNLIPDAAPEPTIGPEKPITEIRSVPVIKEGGFIQTEFPNGEGLDDSQRIWNALEKLGTQIGFSDSADTFLRAAEQDRQERLSPNGEYPYSYPEIEYRVGYYFTADVLQEKAELVNEFAALFLLAAMRQGEEKDKAQGKGLVWDYYYWALPVADVIWRELDKATPSCESKLNRAFAYALGYNSKSDARKVLFDKAAEACPGEVTASWQQFLFDLVSRVAPFGGTWDPSTKWENDDVASNEILKEDLAEIEKTAKDPRVGALGQAYLYLAAVHPDAPSENAPPSFLRRRELQRAADLLAAARQQNEAAPLALAHMFAQGELGQLEDSAKTAEWLLRKGGFEAWSSAIYLPRLFEQKVEKASLLEAFKALKSPTTSYSLAPTSSYGDIGLWVGVKTGRGAAGSGGKPDLGGATANDFGEIPITRQKALQWETVPRMPAQKERLKIELDSSPNEYRGAVWQGQLEDQDEAGSFDDAQDYYRKVGNLSKAGQVIDEWITAAPKVQAYSRQGEVYFLQEKYKEAGNSFAQALRELSEDDLYDLREDESDSFEDIRARMQIKLGIAKMQAGQLSEAIEVLETASSNEIVGARALLQLGNIAVNQQDWGKAADYLQSSIEKSKNKQKTVTDLMGTEYITGASGVAHTNLALALSKADRLEEAQKAAQEAIKYDPASPIYLDNLGFVEQLAGNKVAALKAYEASTQANPTIFTAWNNRGVLLYELGRYDEAVETFKTAVSLRKDYALGWFNLGSALLKSGGFVDYLQAEGALGKAALMDAAFRGAEPGARMDDTVYDSGLDVSKPIPPDWNLAEVAKEPAPRISLTVIALAILALVGSVLRLFMEDKVLQFSFKHLGKLKVLVLSAAGPLLLAVAAVLATQLAAIWSGLRSPWQLLLVATGVLAFIGIQIMTRHLVAPASATVNHGTWFPGLAVGLAAAPFGLGFAPMPVMKKGEQVASWVRWLGVIALLVLTMVVTWLAFTTAVPLIRDLSLVGIVMLASLTLPIAPVDGAFLPGKVLPFIVGLALAGVSISLAINLI